MLALLENMDKATLSAQLVDGVVLMVLGMATVFLFLVVLIYATKLMSKICAKLGGAPKAAPAANTKGQSPQKAKSNNDAAVAAAIASAYDKDKN